MGLYDRDYYDESSGPSGPWSGRDAGRRILELLNASVPIGRYLGISVRVHVTFFLVLVLFLIQQGDPLWTLRWSSLLFLSVLAHEFGHCLACRSVGGHADRILMWPLGGLAFCLPPRRPWPEFVTVVWGPLVSLILAAASWLAVLALHGPLSLHPLRLGAGWPPSALPGLIADLYAVNYVLLLFNLLLIFYPFDGGRLVQIALWTRLGYVRSLQVACTWGMAGAIAVGLLALTFGELWIALIAGFGLWACMQQRQQLRYADPSEPDEGFAYATGGTPAREGPLRRWRDRREARSRRRETQRRAELEREVDRILEKIHAQGLDSLTAREKKILRDRSR